MKVKVKQATDWLVLNREVEDGEEFEVISSGVSKEKRGKTFYFVEKNNKPFVLYEDEVTVSGLFEPTLP